MTRSSDANAGPKTGVRVSTDPAELDIGWIHEALSERAYWARGRSRADVEASIERSICFGAFRDGRQVGFARVVTDGVTFGWVCDVFVDKAERGRGIGMTLIRAVVDDDRLRTLRLALATRDAGALYAEHGFRPLLQPERWMERPRRS